MHPPDYLPPLRPGRLSPVRLLRRPLTWLVAGELLVMLALFAFAWHLWQSHAPPQPALAALPAISGSPAPDPSPPAATPSPAASKPTPRPGLATDRATWVAQLGLMAGDESDWQKTEWRLIQAVVQAAQEYLQRQVLPAITRAQQPPMNSS